MTTDKMKKLALAVSLGLSGISPTVSAQGLLVRAMQVAQDHLGQALIFPYYTVQNGWMTLFGVTNTSNQIVAVKVRFRESYNSRDVMDFNIILSPQDVWTGWVAETGDGPTIFSEDNTCTVGAIPATGVPFPTPVSFVDSAADGGPATVARMNEGYVEMIMMGSADPATLATTALARGAIHSASGAPAGCAALSSAFQNPALLPQLRSEFRYYGAGAADGSVGNPLMGTFSLVNGAEGYSTAGKPVTLANFSNTAALGGNLVTLQLSQVDAGNFYDSWHEPSLNAASGAIARLAPDFLIFGIGGPSGADAVSFLLLQSNVINEWTRRTNPQLGWTTATDWVITFPTKNFYVDNQYSNEFAGMNEGRGNGVATGSGPISTAPFAQSFTDSSATPVVARGMSCDSISFQVYNREEVRATGSAFSPGATPRLCYEANVLTFGGSNILNSAIPASINSLSGVYGWANVAFSVTAGLPAIGFAITSRDDANSALLSEAGLVEHSYSLIVRGMGESAPLPGGN